jgi:predicted nucleic acid-binding protein
MQLVVDANVVFSALIADATTRTLLIDLDHEYYTRSSSTPRSESIARRSKGSPASLRARSR